MMLCAWWDLLLGRKDEFDAALEVKLSTNKSDVVAECGGLAVVACAVVLEGILPFFCAGEKAEKFFLLVF